VTPEVRRLGDEQLPEFVEVMTAGFLERLDVDKVAAEVRGLWDLERTWAAMDRGSICGTLRSWATELTVPGGVRLPASAVAGVTVLPTHRRRGVLRAMVAAEHEAIPERQEVFGLLYASEYPIYGRFGYGLGTRGATWTLDTRSTDFHHAPSGQVELARPSSETRDAMKAVFEAWRLRQAGEIRRREFTWDLDLGLRPSVWEPDWKGFLALHRGATGAVDGYARYRSEGKWERDQPRNVLTVDELHALDPEAYLSLWRFLAEVDWVATVRAERRSRSERLPWLLTNARAATAEAIDGLWVRLFDVPRALEARTYERSASLVLELVDASAAGRSARFHLEAAGDGARCRPTDRPADLTLPLAALGAAYLGGTRLRDAVIPSGADEHRRAALADADALFATRDEPWCSTFF
jgi:predicted acetyltransferase